MVHKSIYMGNTQVNSQGLYLSIKYFIQKKIYDVMFQVACDQTFLKDVLRSIRYSEPLNYYGVEVQRCDVQSFL